MATARRFAAVLGLVAIAVVFVSGMWRGANLEVTLFRGLVALLLFALIGYGCGWLGSLIVKESVASEVDRARKAEQARQTARRPRPRNSGSAEGPRI